MTHKTRHGSIEEQDTVQRLISLINNKLLDTTGQGPPEDESILPASYTINMENISKKDVRADFIFLETLDYFGLATPVSGCFIPYMIGFQENLEGRNLYWK